MDAGDLAHQVDRQEVRNEGGNEHRLVTCVVAKAVHMMYAPMRWAVAPGAEP